MARKARISPAQRKAGERYREPFAVAQPVAATGSTPEVRPGMGGAGPSLKALLERAGPSQAAGARLALYRRRLFNTPP